MLSWVDEASWIAASLKFPDCRFVTVGMSKVEFHYGVDEGVILEINCLMAHLGRTSVSYDVQVSRGKQSEGEGDVIFSTNVTFVNVDENGDKCPIS